MRIHRLTIQNFKRFTEQDLDFHKQFTLLAGENGAGKTSVLDALAVAIGLWHKVAPGSGWRNILAEEVRLDPVRAGDRVMFTRVLPTSITACGRIGQEDALTWTRTIKKEGTRTTNAEAREAELAISRLARASLEQRELLPVLAYYGAGRAWLPTNKRPSGKTSLEKPQQFSAYYNCLDTRIRDRELNEWVLFETAAANGHGAGRPGFRAVKQAVLDCIPGADGLRFDADLKEIVLSIEGNEQPFYNLSAGQRMMLALVADIAIKAVTLNSFLFGSSQAAAEEPGILLERTPGLVLVDELDVHLHPSWQRRVATDLKRTFPSIQFVCTSHSPQVIGEVSRDEVRLMTPEGIKRPSVAYGADSNWLLDHVMEGASSETERTRGLVQEIEDAMDDGSLEEARTKLEELRRLVDGETGELARLEGSLSSLELLAREADGEDKHGEND
jgi:predicted ATP-binding protein involved in virulence